MVNTYLRMFLLLKGVFCIVPHEGYESRDPLISPTFRIGIRESPHNLFPCKAHTYRQYIVIPPVPAQCLKSTHLTRLGRIRGSRVAYDVSVFMFFIVPVYLFIIKDT